MSIRVIFFLAISVFLPTCSLWAANDSLSSVVKRSGAALHWDSGLSRGYLIRSGYRVTFSLGNEEIILGQHLVYGKVTSSRGHIFFDKRTADMIVSYLKEPHSGRYLAFVNPQKREDQSRNSGSAPHHVAVILIDPGHGGRDTGAIGRHGDLVVREKDVTLEVSLALEAKLKKAYPKRKILMTRRTDVYPSLEERVEMANQQKLSAGQAEIFISIHANATPRNPHGAEGFEVWYLPDNTNRKIIPEHQVTNDNLRTALDSVIQEEYLAESRRLAQFILDAMDKGIGMETKNRGIRRENWFVVRNAQMAAVLVELGFVTHEREAQRLANPAYLKTLAQLLYNGIDNFLEYFEQ